MHLPNPLSRLYPTWREGIAMEVRWLDDRQLRDSVLRAWVNLARAAEVGQEVGAVEPWTGRCEVEEQLSDDHTRRGLAR
jgi:hypothetical protein